MTGNIFLFDGFFVDYYIFPDVTGKYAYTRWGGYNELYAEILYWSGGDIDEIPESLREFYNMDWANWFCNQLVNCVVNEK